MNQVKETVMSKGVVLSERNMLPEPQKITFAQYISQKRKEVFSVSGKEGISIGEHAKMLDISQEMFRKILNKQKSNQSRDCIIAICASIGMDVEDTNTALDLYEYYPKLDYDNPRDRVIMDTLNGEVENTICIDNLNERLERNGFRKLDIIKHRNRSVAPTPKSTPRFRIKGKKVRTYTDSLLYGDRYQSLITEYDCSRYHCEADMYIIDAKTEQKYKLTADAFGYMSLEKKPWPSDGNSPFIIFQTLNETGDFQNLFSELIDLAKNEQRRMESFLNDTKNYHERISANFYNRGIHIFYEQYNYVVPEFNEYYLFEYIEGTYRLTVSNDSLFMQKYLSQEEYAEHYGEAKESKKESYDSLEEIELGLKEAQSYEQKDILNLRKKAYKHGKKKVMELLEKFRTRQVFVCNLKHIWEDIDRVCEFFGVTKEFDCKFGGEYEDMMFADKREAKFTLDDGESVLITLDDLYRAFELGFKDFKDVCEVKKQIGSIESILF